MGRLTNLNTSLKRNFASLAVPHLSLNGNTFTLVDGDNKKNIAQMQDGVLFCRVLIVDANPNKSKIYYAEDYSNNPDDQVAPTCFSEDGVFPAQTAQVKQCSTCGECPQNVWGSRISKVSGAKVKACNDYVKLAVIVPSFNLEKVWLFRVPPASLKAFLAYSQRFSHMRINTDQGPREGNVGDAATIVYFDPQKTGHILFQQDELQHNELGLAELVQDRNMASDVLGLAHAQVQDINDVMLLPPAQQGAGLIGGGATQTRQIENMVTRDTGYEQAMYDMGKTTRPVNPQEEIAHALQEKAAQQAERDRMARARAQLAAEENTEVATHKHNLAASGRPIEPVHQRQVEQPMRIKETVKKPAPRPTFDEEEDDFTPPVKQASTRPVFKQEAAAPVEQKKFFRTEEPKAEVPGRIKFGAGNSAASPAGIPEATMPEGFGSMMDKIMNFKVG